MCHCYESVAELSPAERAEVVAEHSLEELRAEHTPAELEALGVDVEAAPESESEVEVEPGSTAEA